MAEAGTTADGFAAITRARELHERAVAANSALRPAVALRLLNSALGRLDEACPGAAVGIADADLAALRAKLVITLAKSTAELSGFESGLAVLRAAEVDLDPSIAPEVLTALNNQRGVLLYRLGRFAEAVTAFDAGEQHFATAPDLEVANVLLNRGTVRMMSGDRHGAERDLDCCIERARSASLPLLEFMALHNRAYLAFVAGDLPAALAGMSRAEATGAGVHGVPLLDRARVLIEAGLVREADGVLARAADIFGRDRSAQDLAETELERARCALAMDDAAGARRLATSARNRFRRRGNDSWCRASELVLLQAQLRVGQPARVSGNARRLHAELRGQSLRLPARIAALIEAEAQLACGRLDAAGRCLATLGPARKQDPITGRMHSHYVHARFAAATGRPGVAARRIRRALTELARYQASFGSIDLRTASAVHGRRLAEFGVSVALDANRPASVFAAAERARAVSSRLPAIRPPENPVVADLLAELRQLVESLRGVEQDRAASGRLLRRRREIERKIVAQSWTLAGDGYASDPVSLDRTRAALGERDQSMIMYVRVGPRLCVVVVGERVRVHDLGSADAVDEWVRRTRADLDVLAHRSLPPGIRSAARSSARRSLAALDAALLAPLHVDGPLVVVSTGLLGRLPWAALPSLIGRAVVVAPSATKWLASAVGAAGRARHVVALAGPELARAADEAAAVGATWPSARVIVGSAATGTALTEALGTADVLHVAAHGVHHPQNPLFSSVRMADGPVFAHELAGRAPDHVVLSACEVGLATVRPGDEALGLASALLHLGTRSVIAGVARVDDRVAEQVMAAYHDNLVAGGDSSVALAKALSAADPQLPPPFVNFGAAWVADLERPRPVA